MKTKLTRQDKEFLAAAGVRMPTLEDVRHYGLTLYEYVTGKPLRVE